MKLNKQMSYIFKTKLLFIGCLLLAFTSSCSNNTSQQKGKDQPDEQVKQTTPDVDSNKDDSVSSDSKDWDALLDSYDSYVTQYISYMKKAARGDMSALSEYPALMEKAQEFSSKMEDAQGDMSASQWSRYIEITNKMTKAAQDIHL